MNQFGVQCGIKFENGTWCMHTSRKEALACSRRLLEVSQANRATELGAKVTELGGTIQAMMEENGKVVSELSSARGKIGEQKSLLEGLIEESKEFSGRYEALQVLVKERTDKMNGALAENDRFRRELEESQKDLEAARKLIPPLTVEAPQEAVP